RQPVGLGQRRSEAEREEAFFHSNYPVASEDEEIPEAHMREGLHVREIIPVTAIAIEVVRLDYDHLSFRGEQIVQSIEEDRAALMREMFQDVAYERDIQGMLRKIDRFDRGGGHELDSGTNQPGDVRICIHRIFGRGVNLIDEIAITGADIGNAARGWDEFLKIFSDCFPDPGPAGMRFVARVEIAGIHAGEGCALKPAGINSNFLG